MRYLACFCLVFLLSLSRGQPTVQETPLGSAGQNYTTASASSLSGFPGLVSGPSSLPPVAEVFNPPDSDSLGESDESADDEAVDNSELDDYVDDEGTEDSYSSEDEDDGSYGNDDSSLSGAQGGTKGSEATKAQSSNSTTADPTMKVTSKDTTQTDAASVNSNSTPKPWYRIVVMALIFGIICAVIVSVGCIVVFVWKHRRNLHNFRDIRNTLSTSDGSIITDCSAMRTFNDDGSEMDLFSPEDKSKDPDTAYISMQEGTSLNEPSSHTTDVTSPTSSDVEKKVDEPMEGHYTAPTLVEL